MVPVIESLDLPAIPEPNVAYKLLPKDPDEAYYRERTDRNIGWITREEQDIIRDSVVGVAGTGGMGGLVSAVLLRAGFGEIRIADCEVFDTSNINRQLAARRETVGKSKGIETARELRRISADSTLVVYPMGISEDTVDQFLAGCDIALDEVEFFAISARILLHQRARRLGIPLINCNVVGFGTRLFFFTPDSMTMEELLGLTYDAAKRLEARARGGSADARDEIIERVMKGLVPEIPEYKTNDREILFRRLREEGKASIFATNPPLSTGFVADRLVLELLSRKSPVKREIVPALEMPGYLYFDAARMEARAVRGRW